MNLHPADLLGGARQTFWAEPPLLPHNEPFPSSYFSINSSYLDHLLHQQFPNAKALMNISNLVPSFGGLSMSSIVRTRMER